MGGKCAITKVQTVSRLPPNNSFKPTPLRGGLTQAFMNRILLSVLLMLLCLQISSAQGTTREESLMRQDEISQNPQVPHSDFRTGKRFKAKGREWLVGQFNITWTETKRWVDGLAGEWRVPSRAELRLLHNSVGATSFIGKDLVWAEIKDHESAWFIFFRNGIEDSYPIRFRHIVNRAVAVR